MSFRAQKGLIQKKITTLLLASCIISPSWSQDGEFHHTIELQTSNSNGQTPLWLNANKFGLSSLSAHNAYARGILSYKDNFDHWDIQYGAKADLVVPVNYHYEGYLGSHYTSHIIVQQLYGELQWRKGLLTIGAKQHETLFRNNQLSSGAQTFGINARPVPQARLELTDWWNIPGTKEWLAFRGHIAFGMMTDGSWEKAFTGDSEERYNSKTRFHEKSGYLRIGKMESFPLSFILGLEMGAQFGGTLYNYRGTDQNGYQRISSLKLLSNMRSYWNAFMPGGGDVSETEFQNAEGNQVGSWIARLDWENEDIKVGCYLDHFFEDHSGMFQIDYDGYGEGSEWREKQKLKFFAYDFKDGQLGLDLTLKKGRFLKEWVIEFMNNQYQSGPVYHDRNAGNSDHLGGIDDYYNHSTLPSWQHWGQALGNPLFRSPQYNTDGYIYFEANRFKAWHTGISGEIIQDLSYRALYSWQRSTGCYRDPFVLPKENTSILLELSYQMPEHHRLYGFKIKAAYGADFGRLLGNNQGLQITLQYNR